jgi:hypothetical protein
MDSVQNKYKVGPFFVGQKMAHRFWPTKNFIQHGPLLMGHFLAHEKWPEIFFMRSVNYRVE